MMRCQLISQGHYQGPTLMCVFLLPPYPVNYTLKTGGNAFHALPITQPHILY